MVSKNPDSWRRLLATVPNSVDERTFLVRMLNVTGADCLMGAVEGGASLAGKPSVFRGPIAESVFNRFYGPKAQPAKAIAPFDYSAALAKPDMSATTRAALVALNFADCVRQRDPQNAAALIESKPASPEELRVFNLLNTSFGPCLTAGNTMSISRVLLRGAVSKVLYRQAAGAPAIAGDTN